jgi:hypothetical protein
LRHQQEYRQGKGKAPKEIQERRRKPAKGQQVGSHASEKGKLFRYIFPTSLVAFVTSYISIVGFLLPSLSVTASSSLDTSDFLRTPFIVTNTGKLSLYSVKISCVLRHAEYKDGARQDDLGLANDFKVPEIAEFSAGDQQDALCNNNEVVMKAALDNAQIDIEIQFCPSFWPFKRVRGFPFHTESQADGGLRWLRDARSR